MRGSVTSSGVDTLTEKVVFLRMLIEKAKLLDTRMTDYVKGFLRENELATGEELEEEKLGGLRPKIQIESEKDEEESGEASDDDLKIEFEEEENEQSEQGNGENYQLDFGSRFKNIEENEGKNEKKDA